MRKIEEVIKQSVPTLVVFQHAGNNDAVEVKYLANDLRSQFGSKVNIERVDASYNGNIKVHFKLEEYPTWILFKEGQELMRESGHKSEAELTDMIRRAL